MVHIAGSGEKQLVTPQSRADSNQLLRECVQLSPFSSAQPLAPELLPAYFPLSINPIKEFPHHHAHRSS